jgi:hypothetical protein
VVVGSSQDLFVATAGSAATLTGLLFVALSVARRPDPASAAAVINPIRVAAALLAFTNALAVALFSLVPGTNAGYPATVLVIIGVFFTAAAVRSILSSQATRREQLRQLELILLLLLIFGTELITGIIAIASPGSSTAVQVISYALVASLLVGIARAWELVGERNTGILASLAVLTGRAPGTPAGTSPGATPGSVPGGTGHDGHAQQQAGPSE